MLNSNEVQTNSQTLAVDVTNACFQYCTNATILDDLTVRIPRGECELNVL